MSISNQPAPVRIVFMGTPGFAVPSLQALYTHAGEHNWQVAGVVTQPDRPAGRGKRLVASPVKEQALAYDLPVQQPERLRKTPEAVEALAALAPDLIVVAAYGLILPRPVLELPTYGCINVHASLLPAYRGASPVVAALLDGLAHTGVSIMLMDEGMDTGPVLAQAQQPIHEDDTAATLTERLAQQGADLLVETLPGWLRGDIAPIHQEELPGAPSVCHMVKKEEGRINWTDTAEFIERMVRAYIPWPSAYTAYRGQPFKILRAQVAAGSAESGVVVKTPDGPAVGTGEDLLRLSIVQPAGKRPLDIASFVNGAPDFIGSRLGE